MKRIKKIKSKKTNKYGEPIFITDVWEDGSMTIYKRNWMGMYEVVKHLPPKDQCTGLRKAMASQRCEL